MKDILKILGCSLVGAGLGPDMVAGIMTSMGLLTLIWCFEEGLP